jgi:hypothetical protein
MLLALGIGGVVLVEVPPAAGVLGLTGLPDVVLVTLPDVRLPLLVMLALPLVGVLPVLASTLPPPQPVKAPASSRLETRQSECGRV